MRIFLQSFCSLMALFFGVFTYGQLVANCRYLNNANFAIRSWADGLPPPQEVERETLRAALRARVSLYDGQIQRENLADGMVINRDVISGDMLDVCDSLLFSSLRYVSLRKLGMRSEADSAWLAMQKSQRARQWLRHPRCAQSTSRDMLLGLLLALSQHPAGYHQHLRDLMHIVEQQNGYFADGPIYVSYLSPGLARLVGMMAQAGPAPKLPDIIRSGYTTAELEVMVTNPGSESHLGALTAWLELELQAQPEHRTIMQSAPAATGSIFSTGSWLVAPFATAPLESQRLDWITDQLAQNNPQNLFFRYLRLRSAHALNAATRYNLMAELARRPEFPADRLPMDCDRSNDYLWQRAYEAPVFSPIACRVQYSGVDFLWMAALLLDDSAALREIAH